MKGRDLRGMPRLRFVGEAGKRREGMVRTIGGASGKEVSESCFLKVAKEMVKKSECRVLRKSNLKRDVIIRGLNKDKIFRVAKGRLRYCTNYGLCRISWVLGGK